MLNGSRLPRALLLLPRALLLLPSLLLSACGEVGGGPAIPRLPSIFDPASPHALALANLSVGLHLIMAVIAVGVIAAMLLIYRRYRVRPGNERGRLVFGNVKAELILVASPALTVLAVFIYSIFVMRDVEARPGTGAGALGGEPVRVTVIGQQWWWQYELPDYGIVTANELHLPVGQPALLELRSDNVMHNWWVPQLSSKRYNIPGQVNYLEFTPTQTGVFGGVCGEFCGIQHAWMRTRVVVESPEAWQAWVQSQATPPVIPASGLAAVGAQVYLARNCGNCHTIDGFVQATANAGPNLSHIASREILAAGRLTNTPENMALWLAEPQEVKPGNLMPDLALTVNEIEALTAFMYTLR